MKHHCIGLAASVALFAAPSPEKPALYDFNMPSIAGQPVALSQYKGKVLLIVNIATESGFTPQLAQLQALYDKYHPEGLEILAFPSNDFGGQERKTDQAIDAFCKQTYHTTFPLFSKIAVRGDDVTPLFHYLSKEADKKISGDVHWNFTKFLVSRQGKLVARFEPDVLPDDSDVIVAIEKELTPPSANSQSQQVLLKESDDEKRPRSDE